MNGVVDDEFRALVKVNIGLPNGLANHEVLVWVDTAFNGSLVLPETIVNELNLPQQSTAEAILADGRKIELATFGCAIHWFGKSYVSQVTSNSSQFGLLGTMLLSSRKLEIDYNQKTVTIE